MNETLEPFVSLNAISNVNGYWFVHGDWNYDSFDVLWVKRERNFF